MINSIADKSQTNDYKLLIPDFRDQPDQNEEWIVLDYGEKKEKILFHDYRRIYEVEGLYEKLFYDELRCSSPEVMSNMLKEVIEKSPQEDQSLRVLDFGAGNGMVGEIIKEEAELVVGVDILEEAKMATERDRPEVYDNYHVLDLSNLSAHQEEKLKDYNFNAMVSVAALGFGDIPPEAFINAFNFVEESGWVAFNIRDKFLTSQDDTGFQEVISWMTEENFEVKKSQTYLHRYSITGDELYYRAFVGQKLKNIDQDSLSQ